MDFGLNGKRALITGSTAGIGFAAARAIAEEGAHVIVNGRTDSRVQVAVEAPAGARNPRARSRASRPTWAPRPAVTP